jgi:hypothetical protein
MAGFQWLQGAVIGDDVGVLGVNLRGTDFSRAPIMQKVAKSALIRGHAGHDP